MIKKQINIPIHFSADSVFQIIEMYFEGRYKTTIQSNSKLHIKRLNKFQPNGRETIQKQLI